MTKFQEVLMFSTVKKVFIILLILTMAIVVGLKLYSFNRTYYNKEHVVGNTAGNIYNGGLFCEQDGWIYFSNDNDDGSLYVMKNDTTSIKKLHNDKAAYINVDENYVYYVRANNTRKNNEGGVFMFQNVGVYRINQNGTNIQLISDQPGNYLTLNGNNLYFQNYDVVNGIQLYRYRIDGTMKQLLSKDAIIPASIVDNKLYYTGFKQDLSIHSMDLTDFSTKTLFEGKYTMPIVFGDYIYYLSMSDKYTLHRMKLDGSDKMELVNERCSTYNITNNGKYLFYQVDSKKARICRLDLETMESETLLEGNYKHIHVTDHYVFFKEFETNKTFILSEDGSSKLGTFNPPNLNSK